MAGHLLPAGGVFAFLAGHRRELFPDELFADLFPSRRGRPSIPADVVASVIVLQTLHGLSDSRGGRGGHVRSAVEGRVRAGGDRAGVPSDGVDLLAASAGRARRGRERIFDAVGQVVAETGVLAGKTRRALDSTVLDDAVATQDTVTQLIAAIRRVAREVPGAAAVIAEHCSGHDYREPGKPAIAWDDPTPGRGWSTPWSSMRTGCSGTCPSGARRRSRGGGRRCWRWWPGRTWSRPRARTAPMGVADPLADRPEGGPGAGDLHRGSRGPARAQDPRPPPGRLQGAREGRAGHRADHRLRADPGRRAGALRRRGRHRAAGRRTRPGRGAGRLGLRHRRAAGTLAAGAGTPRSSSRGRCARPWTAGSPSTSSPSTRPPAR